MTGWKMNWKDFVKFFTNLYAYMLDLAFLHIMVESQAKMNHIQIDQGRNDKA